MTATATPIEVLWTLVSAVGLLGSILLLREAILDRDALLQRPYERPDMLIACQAVRNEVLRVAMLVLFVVVGIRALLVPPANGQPSLAVFLIGVGFTLVALYSTVTAILDRRDRFILMNPGLVTVWTQPLPHLVIGWWRVQWRRFRGGDHGSTG